MHTVTDSFYGHWVYPSFSSSGFVPWLGYSQNTPLRLPLRVAATTPRGSQGRILGYARSSYCTVSVVDVKALGFGVMCPARILFNFRVSMGLSVWGPLTAYCYGCFPSGFW